MSIRQLKDSKVSKIVCVLLIISFLVLDISWAYPDSYSRNYSLASQSVFQKEPIRDSALLFGQFVKSEASFLHSIIYIGKYLLGDPESHTPPHPLEHMEYVIDAEIGQNTGGILTSEISLNEGVVAVPCAVFGKRFIVRMALKDDPASGRIAGTELVLTDKYVVKFTIEADMTKGDGASVEKKTADVPQATDTDRIENMIMTNYAIGPVKSVGRETTKTGRTVYMVDAQSGSYFCASIWEGYGAQQFRIMKGLTDHLIRNGFGKKYFVPEIVPAKNGELSVDVGGMLYHVRRYKGGYDTLDAEKESYFTSINIAQLRSAAGILADYHKAVKNYPMEPAGDLATINALTKRADLLRETLARIRREGNGADEILEKVRSMDIAGKIDSLKASFEKTYNSLPKCPIHGDFQPMNILFSKDEAVGLVDFEHTKMDARLVDFVAGILEMETDKPGIDRRRFEAFFDEYLRHENLTIDELSAIPVMMKLNYLNRVAVAIASRYAKLKEDGEYRRYIQCCLERIWQIENFDWDSIIMPLKVRQIISRNSWEEQVEILKHEFKGTSSSSALNMLLAILRNSTYALDNMRSLTQAERTRLFGKAISLAISSQSGAAREDLIWNLDLELLETPMQFVPEAMFLARSYIDVATEDVPPGTKVATVIAFYGEQEIVVEKKRDDIVERREHYIGDDDFLRTRIEQLEDLYAVNQNMEWELILVGDGDDRDPNDAAKSRKTVDIAKDLVLKNYPDYYDKGKIRILELPEETKKEIRSRKGGATYLGMRDAIDNGASYVFFINAVGAYHAGQEGLLLKELLQGADMAIGSRKFGKAISRRGKLREIMSLVYNDYLSFMLTWVRGIPDTQAGFKAFTRESLQDILPKEIGERRRGRLTFDYGLSFDTDLIARYKIMNKAVVQVPVMRINFRSRISTTGVLINIFRMVAGVFKQRSLYVRMFLRDFLHRVAIGDEGLAIQENKRKSYSFKIYRDSASGEKMVRVESLALHEGERSVMFIRKTGGKSNYIDKPMPMSLDTAMHGLIGHSALRSADSGLSTMEHLSSAIRATGLTGLVVRHYGPACPMLDSSASAWIQIFRKAGWFKTAEAPRHSYCINRPIVLLRKRGIISRIKDAIFSVKGYDPCSIKAVALPLEPDRVHPEYTSILTLPYIPDESRIADFVYDSPKRYDDELADAKTFLPLPLWEKQGESMFMGALPGKNIRTMYTHGKDRNNRWTSGLSGGSDEPARHKIMDMIGDLYLTESEMGKGSEFVGWFVGVGNGHRDNIELGTMIARSFSLLQNGDDRPLMATITDNGRLEYVNFDAKLVLKELAILHGKGYFSGKKGERVYERLTRRIVETHGMPASLSAKKLFLNTIVSSVLAGLCISAALLTGSYTVSALALIISLPAAFHLLSFFILVSAKFTDLLGRFVGAPVKINTKRESHIRAVLAASGASQVQFVDDSALQCVSRTLPDKKVQIGDWVLVDADVEGLNGMKGFLATVVSTLNRIFKGLLVSVVILQSEKRKLSWPDRMFINSPSRLFDPYLSLPLLIRRALSRHRTENPEKYPQIEVSRTALSGAKGALSVSKDPAWRSYLAKSAEEAKSAGDIAGFLYSLSLKDTVDSLPENVRPAIPEYEKIMAKVFSIALMPGIAGNGRQKAASALRVIAKSPPGIRAEAAKLASAYLNIMDLKEPVRVLTLFAMYGEHVRIRPTKEGGEDFLRLKIEQLEDLNAVNPEKFLWELDIVNDGDDSSRDPSPDSKRTSLQIARQIAETEYKGLVEGGRIRFFQLPDDMREKIGSRKGGAIMYGIWKRLRQVHGSDDRPDIFLLTDADDTVPLSFEGLLLPEIIKGGVGMMIGSAQLNEEDISRERELEQILYKIYIKMVHVTLPDLASITDTMMGFKAARTDVLREIIPFSLDDPSETHPVMDPTFVPKMAFDEDMLSRVRASGFEVEEVPVTWVKSEAASFRLRDRLRAVYDSAVNVPADIRVWRERILDKVERWLSANNDYSRIRLIGGMVGSEVSSARAEIFLWTLLGNKLYGRKEIARFLNIQRKDASGHLTRQERVELISRAIALFLRKKDGGYDKARLAWLRSMKENRSDEILPEAAILIDSYVKICTISPARPLRTAMISNLFNSRKALLIERVKQMDDIMSLNPDIKWTMYWVSQDDANRLSGFRGSAKEAEDALREIEPSLRGKIRIIDMPSEESARINNVKGGSVLAGMAEALNDGQEYILYSDMSPVPNLAQTGSILHSLVSDNNRIAIGSRRLIGSVGKRVWFRRAVSYIHNKWTWFHHRNLRTVNDSQVGLKGFTAAQLAGSIPIRFGEDGKRIYDLGFDYGLSFDIALMARLSKNGYGVTEIPIVDTFEMSSSLKDHPLISLYGRSAKAAIAEQARASEEFDGVWRFIGQGGEYMTFSHPSLGVVLQIPRPTSRWARELFSEKGSDIADRNRRMARRLANIFIKTGPTRKALYWYMRHTMKKDQGEERRKLLITRSKLGGLVVPFIIVENPKIKTFFSYRSAVKRRALKALRYFGKSALAVSRAVWSVVRPLIPDSIITLSKKILRWIGSRSIPDKVFNLGVLILRRPLDLIVWLAKTLYEKIIVPSAVFLSKTWPVSSIIGFVTDFLKFDRPNPAIVVVISYAHFIRDQGGSLLYAVLQGSGLFVRLLLSGLEYVISFCANITIGILSTIIDIVREIVAGLVSVISPVIRLLMPPLYKIWGILSDASIKLFARLPQSVQDGLMNAVESLARVSLGLIDILSAALSPFRQACGLLVRAISGLRRHGLLKLADIATRPLWRGVFHATDAAGLAVKNALGSEEMSPDCVIIKEKVVSLGDILLRLDGARSDREKNLSEARALIERFIAFEKDLWRRGAFDYQSHLLGDIGVDGRGNILLIDLGTLTFDMDDAFAKLRPEVTGQDFMTQEVLRRKMSAELYDYYIQRMREEVTVENIRLLWNTDSSAARQVPLPQGIPENAFIGQGQEERVALLYKKLLRLVKEREDVRAGEYLDTSSNSPALATKVILRGMRKGGWEERKTAKEIVESMAGILGMSGYVRQRISMRGPIDWQLAVESVTRRTLARETLDRYIDMKLAKGTIIERDLLYAIAVNNAGNRPDAEDVIADIMNKNGFDIRPSGTAKGSRTKNNDELIRYEELRYGRTGKVPGATALVDMGGKGQRQGLLALQAGRKGNIMFLGRHLAEWVGRTSSRLSAVIPEDKRPVLLSPTDVIFLNPRGEEVEHIRNTLLSDRPVVFFSPYDNRLKYDLSRPLKEDIGELLFLVLLGIPGLGPALFFKIILPYARNAERLPLTMEHGGYDFPGTWAIRKDVAEGVYDIFDKRIAGGWWPSLRLPLRTREQFWAEMKRGIASGLSEEGWAAQRVSVRRFVIGAGGAHARTLVCSWMDCNTPLDIYNIYRGIVDRNDREWRSRLRETFEIEEDADVVDSEMRGDIRTQGNVFINRSMIRVQEGVVLRLGDNVVIDNSTVEIAGKPGDIVSIPDGTVISYSSLFGQAEEFAGNGRDEFLHGVNSSEGFLFDGDGKLFASLVLNGENGPRTFSHDYEFTGKGNLNLPDRASIDLAGTAGISTGRAVSGAIRDRSPPAISVETTNTPDRKEKTVESQPDIKPVSPEPSQAVLVTGATGFIASHLCDAVKRSGAPLMATTRRSPSKSGIASDAGNVKYIDLEFTKPDYKTLKGSIASSKVVHHLVALGNQALTMELPADTYVSNALTTGIIAALCEQENKRMLFSSTFVAYDFGKFKEGDEADESALLPDVSRYPEHAQWLSAAEDAFKKYINQYVKSEGRMDKSPIEFANEFILGHPIPPADVRMLGQNYPLSKILAERLVLATRTGVVLRLNNVYGPEQPDETMIPYFVRSIARLPDGAKFKVWPVKRDLMHVKDLVRILRELEVAPIPDDKRIINISSGTSVRSAEIARAIKRAMGLDGKFDPTGPGIRITIDRSRASNMMPQLRLSNKRLLGIIGPQKLISLSDGMKDVSEYYLVRNPGGCTPEHLMDVLKDEFNGGPVTVYEILKRKRYAKAAILRALGILRQNGLVDVTMDRQVRLYSIYKTDAYINNRRARVVRAGNEISAYLSGPIGRFDKAGSWQISREDLSASIKDKLAGVVREIEKIDGSKMPIHVANAGKEITDNIGRIEADSVIASMLILARRARNDGQKLILGFETDWIPGYSIGQPQHSILNPLVQEIAALAENLRRAGADNVEVVYTASGDLASSVMRKADETRTDYSNVVILASRETVTASAFDMLRSAPDKRRAFIAAVDTAEIKKYLAGQPSSYHVLNTELVKMLSIALELALGKEPPQMPLIFSYDIRSRMVVFLSKAEPVDYETMRVRCMAEKTALSAA